MRLAPQTGPRAALLALGTAVPQHSVPQETIGRWMADTLEASPPMRRWLGGLFSRSGIETRHSCIPDALEPPERSRFAPGRPLGEIATTAERMQIYRREAVELGTSAARAALDDYARQHGGALEQAAASITHLIVVTCTGFFAPGLDQALAGELGLRPELERTIVGFMGCAAAFNGLRLASQIVRGSPEARVLVVCVEICSIHLQPGADHEQLIAASLFADGSAACLVGAAEAGQGQRFEIEGFYTRVEPNTAGDMVWDIGNHGFILRLSPQIPEYLGQVAPRGVRALLGAESWPGFWAIHPGGRGIVDRLAEIFELRPDDLAATREVLRRYGNMSSGTILFVLHELRRRLEGGADAQPGVAMAFGPGLVVEMASLRYVGARDEGRGARS